MKLSTLLGSIVSLALALIVVRYVVVGSDARPPEPESAVPSENPLPIADGPPFPKVEVDSESHNFDRLALGDTGTHKFVFKNVGEAPLKLALGPVQCKCTLGKLDGDEVPPGGSTEVELNWTPVDPTEVFTKSAVIWTNDPNHDKVTLTIEGAVFPRYVVDPKDFVLGSVSARDPVKFTGRILSMVDPTFEITSIETSTPALTVTPRLLTEKDVAIPGFKYGYLLEAELAPEGKAGQIRESIVVKTTLKTAEELKFTVSGSRMSDFSIVGPSWFAGRSTLGMGRFSSEKGKTVTFSLFTKKEAEPLELTPQKIFPEFLEFSFRRDETFSAADRERYIIDVAAPPGSPAGEWKLGSPQEDGTTPGTPGEIVLKTNRPGLEEFTMQVELEIE